MILVVGATGTLGGKITHNLLAKGKPVRVLVRPRSIYRPLMEAGAQAVFGDLKDPKSLEVACHGVDVVISTANSALRGGEDNAETVDLQGNRNLIDAAREAGVKQYIFVSALGVSPDHPAPFFRAKARTEEYLKESGLTYTILAPNAFMEIWPGMLVGTPALRGLPVTLVGEGLRKHSFISMNDVAAFAVAAIGHPGAVNKTIPIGGPEPLSFTDCVAIYGQALGRSIPVLRVAPGEVIPGLGEFMSVAAANFETYDSPLDMAETAHTFGVTLTHFEHVVDRHLAEMPVGAPS